jgi:SAM-dependent methyltransferase
MSVQEFLELFVQELEINRDLQGYYRLLQNRNRFLWRKAYLEQRLEYINNQLGNTTGRIWDAGCGYGTTAIFLALNGHEVVGNTIEFYFDKINSRLDFWSRYGNIEDLRIEYANLYDMTVEKSSYDFIIAQDTLHHLEPVDEALRIFRSSLKNKGRLIITEENGNNPFILLKNIYKRGFRKVTEYNDQKLHKTILLGNENARSMHMWRNILKNNEFIVIEEETEYIRFCPPCCFNSAHYRNLADWERNAGKKYTILREVLFFGINFTAEKSIANLDIDYE